MFRSNQENGNRSKLISLLMKKYSVIGIILLVLIVFVLVLGASYAFFTTTVKGKEFVIYTGNLAVDYKKKTDVINIENLYPMTNTEGLTQNSHEFTVTNNGNIDARYQVRLELDTTENNMVSIEYIKLAYSIDGSDYSEPVLLSNLDSSLTFLRNVILKPTESNTIGIKLWIDINASNEIQGKTFKARVAVDSIQNVEDGYVADTVPIIYLNKDSSGNQDIKLKKNELYTELGVAKIEDDQDVLSANQVKVSYEYYDGVNISTVDSVDTSKTGIYYVIYSVTDSGNNVGKKVRVVTINNTDITPTITLNGDSIISLFQNSTYTELGVTVENNNHVLIIGNVNSSVPGTYIIRYIVIDGNGNLNSVVRTVIVNEPETFGQVILANNELIETEPNLKTSFNKTTDTSGLYKSIDTNFNGVKGTPTYYFRGKVENNYVDFAGFTWRIVRINEDGTIRLIMEEGINNNAAYVFNSNSNNYTYMYYSNSATNGAKYYLDLWYQDNIVDKGYSDKVATGNYYCEQVKTKYTDDTTTGNANVPLYTNYTPSFMCENDGNNKGLINSSIGLLSNDEAIHAGAYFDSADTSYYLYKPYNYWLINAGGVYANSVLIWFMSGGNGSFALGGTAGTRIYRPVININADVNVIGSGLANDHYVIQ